MNKKLFLQIAAMVFSALAITLAANLDYSFGQLQQTQKSEGKFEGYRAAINHSYAIDIANFKDKIPGGLADGKPITNYDLGQLLEGIKVERNHTRDNMLALELAMDHLEYIPDYYTHHSRMERQCDSDKLLSQ